MELLKKFFKEEDGVGVIEMVVILAVLIGLVVVFKDGLSALLTRIWASVSGGADNAVKQETTLK